MRISRLCHTAFQPVWHALGWPQQEEPPRFALMLAAFMLAMPWWRLPWGGSAIYPLQALLGIVLTLALWGVRGTWMLRASWALLPLITLYGWMIGINLWDGDRATAWWLLGSMLLCLPWGYAAFSMGLQQVRIPQGLRLLGLLCALALLLGTISWSAAVFSPAGLSTETCAKLALWLPCTDTGAMPAFTGGFPTSGGYIWFLLFLCAPLGVWILPQLAQPLNHPPAFLAGFVLFAFFASLAASWTLSLWLLLPLLLSGIYFVTRPIGRANARLITVRVGMLCVAAAFTLLWLLPGALESLLQERFQRGGKLRLQIYHPLASPSSAELAAIPHESTEDDLLLLPLEILNASQQTSAKPLQLSEKRRLYVRLNRVGWPLLSEHSTPHPHLRAFILLNIEGEQKQHTLWETPLAYLPPMGKTMQMQLPVEIPEWISAGYFTISVYNQAPDGTERLLPLSEDSQSGFYFQRNTVSDLVEPWQGEEGLRSPWSALSHTPVPQSPKLSPNETLAALILSPLRGLRPHSAAEELALLAAAYPLWLQVAQRYGLLGLAALFWMAWQMHRRLLLIATHAQGAERLLWRLWILAGGLMLGMGAWVSVGGAHHVAWAFFLWIGYVWGYAERYAPQASASAAERHDGRNGKTPMRSPLQPSAPVRIRL